MNHSTGSPQSWQIKPLTWPTQKHFEEPQKVTAYVDEKLEVNPGDTFGNQMLSDGMPRYEVVEVVQTRPCEMPKMKHMTFLVTSNGNIGF